MKPKTILDLQKLKEQTEKIVMLTAYDASFARVASLAGVDILLVGDSLGQVIQGLETTIAVEVEAMAYHTKCVARGNKGSFLLVDLPFMSYSTPEIAFESARVLMQAGAQMLKLEGGAWLAPIVSLLTERGVPICAHLGLQPQSVHILGNYRVQGKDEHAAKRIMEEAALLESVGAQLLVLECIPAPLAKKITASLSIPVIGIGAGLDCDGQVLVLQDMLGLNEKPAKFVRNFMKGSGSIDQAIVAYVKAVKDLEFPSSAETYGEIKQNESANNYSRTKELA
jgi:3-methyl-2-oxobutanoate hydroxymethyltransferase